MEFGQVVLLRSDGSESQALVIRKDVCFGRDHPAHIRVKSRHVARQHALIEVDASGVCYLRCVEAASRPRINGIRMSRSTSAYKLRHLDVITIAGRSFLFKSKSGMVMDLNKLQSAIEGGTQNVAETETECEDDLDSMSLDSRSSHFSSSSLVSSASHLSSCSGFSASTVSRSGKAFALLFLQKKDGTEGSPYAVFQEVVFGSQHPAHIRIKSASLQPEHAKLVIDAVRRQCSLEHLATQLPPRVNGRKMRPGSTVQLRHNDLLSLAGRDFSLRLTGAAVQPSDKAGVENITPHTPHSTSKKPNHSQRKRSFGQQWDENSGFFQAPSPQRLRLHVDTAPPLRSGPSPRRAPGSLSSVSSLSASESDSPSLRAAPALHDGVLVSEYIGDTAAPSLLQGPDSSTIKTYRSGDKARCWGKSDRHVQFQDHKRHENLGGGSDGDGDDDDDTFFDIITEVDQLMLGVKEENKGSIGVYSPARAETETPAVKTEGKGGASSSTRRCAGVNHNGLSGGGTDERRALDEDCDVIDMSVHSTPNSEDNKEEIADDNYPSALTQSECAFVDTLIHMPDAVPHTAENNAAVSLTAPSPLVAVSAPAVVEELEEVSSSLSHVMPQASSSPLSPADVLSQEVSAVCIHPRPAASHMGHVVRLLLSLAVVDPLLTTVCEGEVKTGSEGGSSEHAPPREVQTGVFSCAVLSPPPTAPLDKRGGRGEWFLHTFRFLTRAWRGFY